MKKMRHMKRKALVALVLSVTMLLTLMPGLVFGVSDDQGDPDTVSSSIDYPTVNFTDVAPFLPPVSGTALRRSPARAAGDTDPSSDNGMVVNKTSVYNEKTGAYDITLEAYATGSKVISTVTSDVPTDIVLVLDQSGSMGDDFSTTTSDSWVSYGKRTNDANYNNRMDSSNNKKNRNLYYKLSDGGYAEVRMDRSEAGTVKKYTEYSGNNSACYDSSDTLYTEVNGQYVEVSVSYTTNYYGIRTYTYTYTVPGSSPVTETSYFERGDPPFPIYRLEDVPDYAYTYSYTVNGTRTDIGTSTGADTVFETELYQKIPSGTKITRLEALKNAAATFANSVEEKAKGADGVLGTEDDISHRIAVVGFASKSDYGDNTELLSIAGSNSGSVGVAYHNITRTSRTFFRTWTPPPVRPWSPPPLMLWPPAAPPGRIWVWTWPSASSPPTPCSLTKSATVWSSSLRTAPPPASTALRRMSPTTPSPMPAPSRPPEPPSTPSASSPEPTPPVPAPSPKATLVRTAAP